MRLVLFRGQNICAGEVTAVRIAERTLSEMQGRPLFFFFRRFHPSGCQATSCQARSRLPRMVARDDRKGESIHLSRAHPRCNIFSFKPSGTAKLASRAFFEKLCKRLVCGMRALRGVGF